jgi:hypothetical protein
MGREVGFVPRHERDALFLAARLSAEQVADAGEQILRAEGLLENGIP